MGLPPFHAYGVAVQLYLPVVSLVTAAVYAPRAVTDPRATPVIPTSGNMLEYATRTGCKALMTVPTFLEQWAVSQENVEELKTFEVVVSGVLAYYCTRPRLNLFQAYSGGPLSETIGNNLCAAGVAVGTFYGGTEFGCPTVVRMKADIKDGDWNWMRFSDDIKIRWVPHEDGSYECQVLVGLRCMLRFVEF